MQVEVADTGTFSKQVTITYSPDEVRERREQVIKRLANQVSLKGFRPGKSSRAVLEKRFGETATAQTEDDLVNEGLSKAVREKGLKPIGPIKDEGRTRDNGLRLSIAFEVKPPVTLPEPTTLKPETPAVEISDAQIDETLTSYAKRLGAMTDLAAGETLAADDAVTLAGAVTVGGEVARECKDFQHLLGAYPLFGKQPDEVLKLAAGQGVGAKIAFSADLPSTFKPEQFAGKSANVELTVQQAQRLRPAAIDDEFAKKVGATDIADLRAKVRDGLKRQKENEQHQQQLEQLQDKLIASATVDLPPKLLATLVEERTTRAKAEGKADAETSAKPDAEKTLKRWLVLDAAADQLKVQVTRQDIEGQVRLAAARSGRPPEEVAKRLTDSGRINDVLQEIREAKTLEVLLDLALGRARSDQTDSADEACAVDHVHGPECAHGHAH